MCRCSTVALPDPQRDWFLHVFPPLCLAEYKCQAAGTEVRRDVDPHDVRKAAVFRRMPTVLAADVAESGADQRELNPSHEEAIYVWAQPRCASPPAVPTAAEKDRNLRP